MPDLIILIFECNALRPHFAGVHVIQVALRHLDGIGLRVGAICASGHRGGPDVLSVERNRSGEQNPFRLSTCATDFTGSQMGSRFTASG